MGDPTFWDNQEKAQVVIGNLKRIKLLVDPFLELEEATQNTLELLDMAIEESDEEVLAEVKAETRKLNKEFNQTFVLVTHSQRVAGQLDRVLELVGGKLNPINQNLMI